MSTFQCLVDGSVPSDTEFLYIESIQPFEITIGTSATSNTATISSVNTGMSAVFFAGFNTTHTGTSIREFWPRVELTNSTTVTAFRDTSSASQTVTLRGTIVEFDAACVNSVQHGTVTISSGNTSGTATISSVTTSLSAVMYLGATMSTTTTSYAVAHARIDLTNATTITANRAGSSTAVLTVGYCVVEFNASAVASIQQRVVTISATSTSTDDTISSVNTGRTLLLYAGVNCNTSTLATYYYNLELTGIATVTLRRTGTGSTTRTINYTVVEFAPGVVASLQRGSTVVASVASNDGSITSVDTAKALAIGCITRRHRPRPRRITPP